MKRCLLLGRTAMTNLDSVFRSRDITLPTKLHIVKAVALAVVMHRCENWTIKKAEHQRINAFQLWCWRRLLRVPWTARRSNQSILKEINPKYSWKDWCWSWSSSALATWCELLTHWKRFWDRLRAREEGDRRWDGWMASLSQCTWVWVNSRRYEGQGSLVCCSPWDHRVGTWLSNRTSQLSRGQVNMTDEVKLCSPIHSSFVLLVVWLGIVTEKNWFLSVDRCRL